MVRSALLGIVVLGALAAAAPASADGPAARFDAVTSSILAEPYQPDYVPLGFDSAFDGPIPTPNTAPAEDYTSGSIPGDPDTPSWPSAFHQVLYASGDGAPLFAMVAIHPGTHPGVVVVHGFNTHGYLSVIRWAAMLYASGYDVIASDQRDFFYENQAGYESKTAYPQTFGWKESEDVLAAGRYLAAQPGVGPIGVVGFSEGAQNTVLALALDAAAQHPVFSAGLAFSGPADQNTQISYDPAATDALVALVTPGEATACGALADASAYYGITGFAILAHETAMHAQTQVRVPLLDFYSADDSLVPPVEASLMAAYQDASPLQRTVLLQKGEHAYFFDRWWQQRAILLYFHEWLGQKDLTLSTTPTVNQTAGGASAGSQTVDLGAPTRAWADAQLAPYTCDASQGVPGTAR